MPKVISLNGSAQRLSWREVLDKHSSHVLWTILMLTVLGLWSGSAEAGTFLSRISGYIIGAAVAGSSLIWLMLFNQSPEESPQKTEETK